MIKTKPLSLRALMVLITAFIAMGVLSVSLYTPSMPAIAQDLGTTMANVQRTLTMFLIGFAGAQLIYGPLSDYFGRRPVLLTGLSLYIISSLVCALAEDIFWLQIFRLAQGIAACSGQVIGRAMVRDLFERDQSAKVFAFVGTVIAVVPAFAPIIGGQLQIHTGGWKSGFLVLAFIGVILITLTLRYMQESNPNLKSKTKPITLLQQYVSLTFNGRFMGRVLVGALQFAGLFAYTTIGPFLFIQDLNIGADVYGFLMMVIVVAYASGSHISGRLIGRYSPHQLILFGCGCAICGATLMVMLSGHLSVLHVLGPLVIYLFGFGLVMPPSTATALHPFPRIAGSAAAMIGFTQMGAAAVSSYLMQSLYDGSARPLALVILCLSIAAFLAYIVFAHGGEDEIT